MPPSQDDKRHVWLFGIGVTLVIIAVFGWRAMRAPTRLGPVPTSISVADLEALLPYAQPGTGVPRTPRVQPEPAAVARDPFTAVETPIRVSRGPAGDVPKVVTTQRELSVTAILITESRRAAVINDVLVSLGDQLPGGSRLIAVERDHVIVTDAKGARRTINVNDGNS
jgi:hypothetical protein